MNSIFDTISIDQIDQNCSGFELHPYLRHTPVNNDFVESINRCGLLTPPILKRKKDSSYEIVCGRQRIQALKLLGETDCCCQILAPECPVETLLTIVIEDQFNTAPLNIVEQANFVSICNTLKPETKRFQNYIHTLLPGRITKGIRFLKAIKDLALSLQSAIHHGNLTEKILGELINLSEDDQQAFLELIKDLQISANNQKKLINKLSDILRRDGIALHEFFKRADILEILGEENIAKNQKTSRLIQHIETLHQPLLSQAEKSFEEEINKLQLPPNCSLTPSLSFEKNVVTLKASFANLETFKTQWQEIGPYLKKTTYPIDIK